MTSSTATLAPATCARCSTEDVTYRVNFDLYLDVVVGLGRYGDRIYSYELTPTHRHYCARHLPRDPAARIGGEYTERDVYVTSVDRISA